MMWWNSGVGGLDWFWIGGMMLLFWGGLMVLAVFAFRAVTGPKQTGDAALDVLRRRLAAGEITPEEFDKTKKSLGA